MKNKKCSKCKKVKLLSDFDKKKNEEDGFHSHCKGQDARQSGS